MLKLQKMHGYITGYGIQELKVGYRIWNMGYEIWDMGYEIWDMEYGV